MVAAPGGFDALVFGALAAAGLLRVLGREVEGNVRGDDARAFACLQPGFEVIGFQRDDFIPGQIIGKEGAGDFDLALKRGAATEFDFKVLLHDLGNAALGVVVFRLHGGSDTDMADGLRDERWV